MGLSEERSVIIAQSRDLSSGIRDFFAELLRRPAHGVQVIPVLPHIRRLPLLKGKRVHKSPKQIGQLLLRHVCFLAEFPQRICKSFFHRAPPIGCNYYNSTAGSLERTRHTIVYVFFRLRVRVPAAKYPPVLRRSVQNRRGKRYSFIFRPS